MRRAVAAAWVGCVALANADASPAPLGKVLQLLGDLRAQLGDDFRKEGQLYDKYSAWCDSAAQWARSGLSASSAKAADLGAYLQEQAAFRAKESSEIEALSAEVNSNEEDLKEARDMRAKEHQSYVVSKEQATDSIEQLEAAIELLEKKQAGTTSRNVDFLEVATTLKHALERNPDIPLDAQQQQTLNSFFQATIAMRGQQQGAPQQSSFLQASLQLQPEGVLGTLQSILGAQQQSQGAAAGQEQKAQDSFALMDQSLSTEIANGRDAMQEKQLQVTKSQETASQKTAELNEVRQAIAASQQYLQDVVAQCQQKALTWKERQKLRTDEISAITQALTMLSSPEAQQLAAKQGLGASFLQTQQVARRNRRVGRRAVHALRSPGAVSLLEVSSRVRHASWQAKVDPFASARKTIQEMIVRLLNEAAQEMEHKEWCDTEMKKSDVAKSEHLKDIRELKSEIDQMEDTRAQVEEEEKELSRDMVQMEQMVAEAMANREGEKTQSLISVKQYQDGQTLLQNAISVLQEFYKNKSQPPAGAALSQLAAPVDITGFGPAPPTFEGPYQGAADAVGGVVGIIQVAISDFARLETETQAQEAAAQREYDAFARESADRKAISTRAIDEKRQTAVKLDQSLRNLKSDLAGYEKELDAVNAYINKLTPSCTEEVPTYEDHKERREKEIKSLQEALQLLNGEAVA